MKNFDLLNFIKNIEIDISEADRLVHDMGSFFQTYDGGDREEADSLKESLRYVLETLHLKMIYGMESLQLTVLLQMYLSAFSKYSTDVTVTEYNGEYDFLSSPVCDNIRQFKSVLKSQVTSSADNREFEINLLESILRNTAKFLFDFNITPKSELDVQKCMYKILNVVFPSTAREVVINQIGRNYKVDFGIINLGCAIEYKFVDSPTEMTKCYGALYEDMKGYKGSAEWTNFYAVIYMTAPFVIPEQIREDGRRVKVPSEWNIILVQGSGERKLKAKKSMA